MKILKSVVVALVLSISLGSTVSQASSLYSVCETKANYFEFFLAEGILSEEQIESSWSKFEKAAEANIVLAAMEVNDENVEIMAQVACVRVWMGNTARFNSRY
jgi:hypothetical protein